MASKLRIHELELYNQPTSHLRLYELQLSGVAVNAKLRIFEIELLGNTPVADQTVESLSTVTIPTPTSQTGGPTVTLSGSGGTRTFTAPATVNGATITFAVGATSLNIAVKAHQWWVLRGTVWKPFQINII